MGYLFQMNPWKISEEVQCFCLAILLGTVHIVKVRRKVPTDPRLACVMLSCSNESLLTAYRGERAAQPPPFPAESKRCYPAIEAAPRSHLPVFFSLLLQRHLSGPGRNEFTPWCLLELFYYFFK